MARINLLPWREELRKQKKQEFLIAIGGSIVATLIAFALVHTHIEGLKSYQEERNQRLEQENAKLDKKLGEIKDIEITKNKLLAKIALIQKLQSSRPEIVHLFDEIPRVTPEGVYLTSFAQSGVDLKFEGKSQSNARVSAFMRAIESSHWLQQPSLDVINSNTADVNNLSDFKLTAKQGKPQTDATK
jgi:type IV pilus assembly protein PilN